MIIYLSVSDNKTMKYQLIYFATIFIIIFSIQFQQSNDQTTSVANHSIKPPTSKRSQLRLQDKGLQEVVDGGMCLSMHQPWASLLVAGIKMYVPVMAFT